MESKNNYHEDLIPVEFIRVLAEGTGIKWAEIALKALILNWRLNGEEWCETLEKESNYE